MFRFDFDIFIDIDELYSSEGSIGRLFLVVKGYDASNLSVLDTPPVFTYTSQHKFRYRPK